jgi:geranylgeranyl pyrophosphate synthase
MVRDITSHPEYCTQLRDFVISNGGIEYATSKLEFFVSKAIEALEVFAPTAHRDMLNAIAKYNAIRTK